MEDRQGSAASSQKSFIPPMGPPPFLYPRELLSFVQTGYADLARLPEPLQALYDRLLELSGQLFALSKQSKGRLFPPRKGDELGYAHLPGEKEFVTFRARRPTSSDSVDSQTDGHADAEGNEEEQDYAFTEAIENVVREIWAETGRLFFRILHDISRLLGFQFEAWDDLLGDALTYPASMQDATPSLLRTFSYFPESGGAERHTDLGLLTLCVCNGEGLEVLEPELNQHHTQNLGEGQDSDIPSRKSQDGRVEQWRPAPRLTLLAGDMLRLISAGRVSSGVHRVVPNSTGRQSIVFALRPSLKARIDMGLFGLPEEGQIDAAVLWRHIKERRVNVNADRETRERTRREKENFRKSGKLRQSETQPASIA